MKGIEHCERMGDWYEEMRLADPVTERTQAFEDEPNAQPIGHDVCWECGHEVEGGRCRCKGQHWA